MPDVAEEPNFGAIVPFVVTSSSLLLSSSIDTQVLNSDKLLSPDIGITAGTLLQSQFPLTGTLPFFHIASNHNLVSGNLLEPTPYFIEGNHYLLDPIIIAMAPLTVGGNVKVWDGSVWHVKALAFWDGVAFSQKPVKIWTGSEWRNTNT